MEKRLIIALALSLMVLIGFQIMFPAKSRIQQQPLPQPQQQAPAANKTIIPVDYPEPETPAAFTDDEEVVFENKLYTLTFTDIGGALKKITLNKNPDAGLNVPYEIFNAGNPANSVFLFFPDELGKDLNTSRYTFKKNDNGITFICNLNSGVSVEKRFYIHNSLYRIDLEIVWRNNKTGEIKEKYGLVSGVYIHSKPGEERFMEVSANLAGTVSKHKKQGKPFEIQKDGQLSWLMLKNRYFSMVLRPFEPCSGYFTRQSPSGVIIAGPSAQEFNIPANSSVTHKFGLYLGPSDLSLLKASDLGAESALSYGIFGSISQLLISMLKFFHKIARNWGVAILLLTFIINLALLPLTRKSYKSMQEMQILQPKIEKLRKELKDNPQKLQREIMELYKKYRINPMGGCLPMLLQMPIFIALYNGLMGSVELRGAKFLWINDLSTPENIKMPFSLPLVGNSLNILPLLMLVAMYFQQKLSSKMASMAQTDEQRKQQQFMSVMMTVMFGFIFYNFPSGLVLYWFVNTVLMTAYQIIFTKPPKHAEEIA